jgi:hypothetical protein
MAGLDPAIHVLLELLQEGVDARVKPAHDDRGAPRHASDAARN